MDKVLEYRMKHKRCRLCQYSQDKFLERVWVCTAKNKLHGGFVGATNIAGCFCHLYCPDLPNSFV